MLDIEKITSSGTEEEKAIVEKVRKGEKFHAVKKNEHCLKEIESTMS